MHHIHWIHGFIIVPVLFIMEILTFPVNKGSFGLYALNNSLTLSEIKLSMNGTQTTDGLIKTLQMSAEYTGDTGIELNTDSEEQDYDFIEGTNITNKDITPEYMLELYNNLSRNSPFLHNSNIIRSFKNLPRHRDSSNMPSNLRSPDISGCRTHSLKFDISTIDRTSERLNLAELRLYTLIKKDQNSFHGVNRIVKIYEVLNFTDSKGMRKYNFITSKYVHQLENAWESFDVTIAVKRSLKSGAKLEHLEVRIYSLFTANSEDNMDFNADPNHIKQPILVVYSNDINVNHARRSNQHEVIMHELTSSSVAGHPYSTPALTDNLYSSSNMLHSRTKRSRGFHRNSGCRRRPMYVNFADIEYDTWIIAPRGYQAYQCAGRCYVPISENLSPSNHAIIQALLHKNYHRRAGKICCVPTELDPISLLYIDSNGVVTYKYMFDGMVVSKCGCR